ncbi:MAG: DUF4173 domain-containing protein [Butyrivibrio sp.]|nr:DUF4173 domain-containing protein [Muribaculum sp.]MCM1552210.1 DUF4173 domain-containing protein [Butyrivibrio sp.]
MPYIVQSPAKPVDTEATKRMKNNFAFFGPVTFLYALFYAFCMFKNGSGITFPFFIAASLLYLYFSLSKLEITLKRGSAFYMAGMLLLAVSTFCTDDERIIAFNKTGIFLLMMSLLLKQFYDTSNWKLGKYLGSIFRLVFAGMGEFASPFADCARYFRSREGKQNKNLWYALLGAVLAIPLLAVVIALLSSADAVFRQMTDSVLQGVNFGNIINVIFRIGFMFFASYLLTAYLCKHTMSEQVKDHRNGEPVLAITVTALLSVIYLLFSGIQIIYVFLGKMELPEGYTYAEYAREGFAQLLAVSFLNLIIVLFVMSYFRESKVLKVILTVMSLCTFIMIASSAFRMILYIRFYYMTFLRILVLWGLALLFLLFIGVIVSIYKGNFPLFGYSTVVVTVLYVALSFAHPDYIIASVNVSNALGRVTTEQTADSFFLTEKPYQDFSYLSRLSADAAPVLIPYMKELGYDMDLFYAKDMPLSGEEGVVDYSRVDRSLERMVSMGSLHRSRVEEFGLFYLRDLQRATEDFGIRTYNISRHIALREIASAR